MQYTIAFIFVIISLSVKLYDNRFYLCNAVHTLVTLININSMKIEPDLRDQFGNIIIENNQTRPIIHYTLHHLYNIHINSSICSDVCWTATNFPLPLKLNV